MEGACVKVLARTCEVSVMISSPGEGAPNVVEGGFDSPCCDFVKAVSVVYTDRSMDVVVANILEETVDSGCPGPVVGWVVPLMSTCALPFTLKTNH